MPLGDQSFCLHVLFNNLTENQVLCRIQCKITIVYLKSMCGSNVSLSTNVNECEFIKNLEVKSELKVYISMVLSKHQGRSLQSLPTLNKRMNYRYLHFVTSLKWVSQLLFLFLSFFFFENIIMSIKINEEIFRQNIYHGWLT